MTRKICPKDWPYAKITTKNGKVYYKKVRKLNQYSYGIHIPKKINSSFTIEQAINNQFPFSFSANIIRETESYNYIIIPYEIGKILNLNNKDIIKYNFEGSKIFFGKIKKKCNSLILNITKKEIKRGFKKNILITLIDKLELEPPLEKIIIKLIKNKYYFDLKALLPKYTSRDNIPFKVYEIDNKNILICCEFKHVKGLEFKYIIFPRFLNAKKLAMFFGLMHSDGFKKFGYKEIYHKHINSPYVGFTNGEPQIINLFLELFDELFRINRQNFHATLRFPLDIDENQKIKLKGIWNDLTKKIPKKIYKDVERMGKWCPAGILDIGIYNILMAEIIISSLKKFLKNIDEVNLNSLKKNFLIGILIGDGSPILTKKRIRRVMIAVEFKEEGDIYANILNSLGYKARNLCNKNKSPRLVDIGGGINSIESFIENLGFGFWEGDKYYGSLEKHYKLLKGHKNHSNSKRVYQKEIENLELMLKTYIKRLSDFVPIPKYYEELLEC